MSQLNFYVPDEIEDQIRIAAKNEGKSISAFLADLVKAKFFPKKWPDDFFKNIAGGWHGDFEDIQRDPPPDRDSL